MSLKDIAYRVEKEVEKASGQKLFRATDAVNKGFKYALRQMSNEAQWKNLDYKRLYQQAVWNLYRMGDLVVSPDGRYLLPDHSGVVRI